MFHITLIAIGKNKDYWVDAAVEHYLTFLKKYAEVTLDYIPDAKQSKNLSETELRRAEAVQIQKRIKSSYQIAMSEKGKSFNSKKFADFLQQIQMKSGDADFIIGGIYGLDDSILRKCHTTLSLSPMTMSHQLVRPVLLEQIYRAFSIISGGKYHK
jgi:23S rRNA (pseudouridine1915-N3)-methyltransferase